MEKNFKPTGYNSVSPYFILDDAQRFIDLMKAVFNAEQLRRYDRPDGSIMHTELRIDDSVIMLASATKEYTAAKLWMHVYVADAKATYEKALAAGCEGVQAPVNKKDDPDTRGTFKDFAGNVWSIGTQRQ